MARVSDRARGDLLKTNGLDRYAWAENCGLRQAGRMRLRVSSAWARRRSHPAKGKLRSHDARPARKWFLKVWIARSAALRQCICGGAS